MGAPGPAEPGERTAGSGAAAGPRPHCRFPPPGAALGELSPAAAAAESCDSAAGFARVLPAPPAAPAGSWHTPGTGGRRPRPPPRAGGRPAAGARRAEPRPGGAAPGRPQRCGPGPAVVPAAASGMNRPGGSAFGVARGSITGGWRSPPAERCACCPWAEPAPSQPRQSPLILRDKTPCWRVYLPSPPQARRVYFPQEAIG